MSTGRRPTGGTDRRPADVICSKLEAYACRQINNYRPRDKGETMRTQPMSAFGGKADINRTFLNVCF